MNKNNRQTQLNHGVYVLIFRIFILFIFIKKLFM